MSFKESWAKARAQVKAKEEAKAREKAIALAARRAKKGWTWESTGGLIVLIALVTFLVHACGPDTPEEKAAKAAAEETKTCENEIMAWIQAKEYVRKNLKAPSTADFSSRTESKVTYLGNCKHEVLGYVDAQNSFGAKIRSQYDVIVQYHKAPRAWVPLKINID